MKQLMIVDVFQQNKEQIRIGNMIFSDIHILLSEMIGKDGAAADFSSSTYGMMSPEDLDLLTRSWVNIFPKFSKNQCFCASAK